ncbi:MAG: hypothetical protein SVU24_00235 [Pseudomonadota bacterium]|nr:hypothetical protein [Pseudomonadota bacterium]
MKKTLCVKDWRPPNRSAAPRGTLFTTTPGKLLTIMNKSPDLVLTLVIVFIVGAVMTGISQSDLQLATMVQQVFQQLTG